MDFPISAFSQSMGISSGITSKGILSRAFGSLSLVASRKLAEFGSVLTGSWSAYLDIEMATMRGLYPF